jgi:uncharacterized membrane protein
MANRIISRKESRWNGIRWRSHEPSRLETFSDAVFAFALTLIILSVEVPKTFNELFELMKGALSFAASFSILFMIWYNQNTFFRRFGLHDPKTIFLNAALLFFSLIYIYPLKFLSVLLLRGESYGTGGEKIPMIQESQIPILMVIYSSGYTLIFLLFFLMYRNAVSFSKELELTQLELFHTQTITTVNLISVFIGLTSILIALLLPQNLSGFSGFVYFLIGPTYLLWYRHRGRLAKKLNLPENNPALDQELTRKE